MKKILLILALGFAASLGAQTPPPAAEQPAEATSEEEAAKKKEAAERERERRIAEVERQREKERIRDELYKACVIKPVMSDAEIEACRRAYRSG